MLTCFPSLAPLCRRISFKQLLTIKRTGVNGQNEWTNKWMNRTKRANEWKRLPRRLVPPCPITIKNNAQALFNWWRFFSRLIIARVIIAAVSVYLFSFVLLDDTQGEKSRCCVAFASRNVAHWRNKMAPIAIAATNSPLVKNMD